MMKLYGYMKCGTCRKAMKWLDAQAIAYDFVDITQTPPKVSELNKALSAGYELKDLFNKSGGQYRDLNMKYKLPLMSDAEAIKVLASNGYLVRRPICMQDDKITVGFKEDAFEQVWG